MTNSQVYDYIKGRKAAGASDEEIKQALLAAGWDAAQVADAFSILEGNHAPVPPPPANSPSFSPKLPGSMTLVKESWGILKSRAREILGVYFLPIALTAVGGLLAAGGKTLFQYVSGINAVATVAAAVIGLCFMVFYVYFMIWGQIALFYAIKDGGEGIGIKESYRRARPIIWRFLWVSIIMGSVSAGGFLLLIIPGIIFSVWFGFSQWVLISENLRGFGALFKSKAYVSGYWWAVLGRSLFLGLIAFAAYIIFALIAGILRQPAALSVLQMVFSFFAAPFIMIYQYRILEALKAIKQLPQGQTSEAKKWPYVVVAVIGGLLLPVSLLASVVLVSLNSARALARDAARASHIRMINTGLELYYNDYRAYPDSLSQLNRYFPSGIPTVPQPADGGCTAAQNQYRYSKLSGGGYELKFCLGRAAGGYSAGEQTFSPVNPDQNQFQQPAADSQNPDLGAEPKNVYFAYRAELARAGTPAEIKNVFAKYMVDSKYQAVLNELSKSSVDYQNSVFELIKNISGSLTDIETSNQDITESKAVFALKAFSDIDNKNINGTLIMVKENGVWKIDSEDWKSSK